MVSTTSIQAFKNVKSIGKDIAQHRHIKRLLDSAPAHEYSRAEIAEILKMRLSSVCARVREMLDKGLIIEGEKRQCTITNASVSTIKSKKSPTKWG